MEKKMIGGQKLRDLGSFKIIDQNGSEWGIGETEEEAYENAKENYLSKYPEEENNLDIVDSFDCIN